jgi:hypothetical protein
MATRTMSIEESVLRSARSYLYGHSLAWDVRGDRAGRARTSTRRKLPRLAAALTRARGGRTQVADSRRPSGWRPTSVSANGSVEKVG